MPNPKETLQVSEYDRITNDRLLKDLTSLYVKDGKWSRFLKVQNSVAYFKHYVGTVRTEHFTVSILPKVWAKDDQIQESTLKNLLRILLYTYLTPSFFEPETLISPKSERNDLFELLIFFYSITLEKEMTQGMYRRYVRRDEISRYLRGKLNLSKQLNRLDKSLFEITDFRFSSDNELNRYFAYATSLFSRFTQDLRNLDLLESIELIFQSEAIESHTIPVPVSFNRLNDRFQIPYNYADLIIRHMRPEPGNGKQAMMMLFDMNILFQEFFVKFIKKNKLIIFPDCTVKIEPQYKNKNFIFNKSGALRLTIPDLWIEVQRENHKKTFILDTKYKIMQDLTIEESSENSDEDVYSITSHDLYQAFTYSELYKPNGTILVFPGKKNQLSQPYNFKKDGLLLWFCMLRLDFNKDVWEKELAEEFRGIFNKIASF
jgi:5-methylcytosine-specific restriction endonuclease McrBC regulatory subunit McrC